MTAITDALTRMDAVHQQLGVPANLYGIVLAHGDEHTPAPLPARFSRGEPRQCFSNALAIADLDGLQYVEGFGLRPGIGHLFHHGWCVAPDGTVVDPTWDHPENTVGYYGIVFDTDWVIEQGYTGVALERYAARLAQEGRLP